MICRAINFNIFLSGLNGFTLSLHNTAKRGNLILDEQVAIVFEIKDGRIVTMATYLSDVAGIMLFLLMELFDIRYQ